MMKRQRNPAAEKGMWKNGGSGQEGHNKKEGMRRMGGCCRVVISHRQAVGMIQVNPSPPTVTIRHTHGTIRQKKMEKDEGERREKKRKGRIGLNAMNQATIPFQLLLVCLSPSSFIHPVLPFLTSYLMLLLNQHQSGDTQVMPILTTMSAKQSA